MRLQRLGGGGSVLQLLPGLHGVPRLQQLWGFTPAPTRGDLHLLPATLGACPPGPGSEGDGVALPAAAVRADEPRDVRRRHRERALGSLRRAVPPETRGASREETRHQLPGGDGTAQ